MLLSATVSSNQISLGEEPSPERKACKLRSIQGILLLVAIGQRYP